MVTIKKQIQQKVKRITTCLKPISKHRKGKCVGCGSCCKLLYRCPFLSPKNKCLIYKARPLNCKKYPRNKQEHIPNPKCGFYFKGVDNEKK